MKPYSIPSRFLGAITSLWMVFIACQPSGCEAIKSQISSAAEITNIDTSAAQKLAANVVKAFGGIDNIKKFNATAYRAVGKLDQVSSISGTSNLFDFEILTEGYKQKIQVSFMGQPVITGYDGNICWTQQGDSILPTDEITSKRVKEDLVHGLLLIEHFLEPERKMRLSDDKKIKDKMAKVLIVTADDNKETTFFIDPKTNFILRSQYDGTDIEQGTDCLKGYEYRDYRAIDQTVQPYEISEFSADKRVSTITISRIETGLKLIADYFSMPVTAKIARLQKGPVTLPFRFSNNEILARIKVNDKKELLFLVDTGATQSIIDTDSACELGNVEAQDISITTGSGAMKMKFMTIDSLTLGDLVLEKVPVAVADLRNFAKVLDHHVDGLIGANVLKRFQITIDYEKEVLILKDPDKKLSFAEGSQAVILKAKPSLGVSGLALEGIIDNSAKVTFLVDTGAAFNHISEHLVKNIVNEPVLRVGTIKGLDGLPVRTGSVRFKSLTLGGLLIEQPIFSLAPSDGKASSGLIAGGNLAIIGNPLLSNYRVTIDYRQQKIMFETTRKRQSFKRYLALYNSAEDDFLANTDNDQALIRFEKLAKQADYGSQPAVAALAEAQAALLSGRKDKDNTRSPQIQSLFRQAFQKAQKSGNKEMSARVLSKWALYHLESKPESYFNTARALTSKALMTAPNESLPYALAGMILMKEKGKDKIKRAAHTKPPKAVQLLDQSLMLDPSNWLALWAKLDLAKQKGDSKETILIEKQLSRYHPNARRVKETIR
ncbi:MAG: aspartyl protease family protein [Candidatus Obscuribacterales bacterium]|nr:aspartyl protease family protein [Candidatus Obscuribacterales bacterium]